MKDLAREIEKTIKEWQIKGGIEPAKKLFATCLDFKLVSSPIDIRNQPWKDEINGIPEVLAEKGSFRVLYFPLNGSLRITIERKIINSMRRDHPYAIFLFSDSELKHWHMVNPREPVSTETKIKGHKILRRITIGPHEKIRTAIERLMELSVEDLEDNVSPLIIQEKCDRAFDVEAVTKQFFEDYKKIFSELTKILSEYTDDQLWAHDYALQFLNRFMFLYFVQRKRWLGNDPHFIRNFWESYKETKKKDRFYSEWLSVLFFETFNGEFQAGRHDHVANLPENIRNILALAPHLNGGLYRKNDLDEKFDRLNIIIPDSFFATLFDTFKNDTPGFFERYNFTITEDTPLDQEVAVNPEMIGKVYESLVNISTEEDKRSDMGIFYTQRVEIDLMCRLSLVDWLSNNLGSKHKNKLYELVFAYSEEEKEAIDKEIEQIELWPKINELLRSITILDPSCGSGSFLVGMLMVLDDLIERASKKLGFEETAYVRRKNIIGRSLYGVDIMEWAVHIAELRLWLQLIVEAEIDPLKDRDVPLLPNLSFNIRPGDSLLQEIGDFRFNHNQINRSLLSKSNKKAIKDLKQKKLDYFLGKSSLSEEKLREEEINLFKDIIKSEIKNLEETVKRLNNQKGNIGNQTTFFEDSVRKNNKVDFVKLLEKTIIEKNEKIVVLKETLNHLDENVPFVWDIAFVEVFESNKKGFDIVIGNPPYVRHEDISDPLERMSNKDKKYKKKLQEVVAQTWPNFYGYKEATGKSKRKFAGRSDLYVYFYFIGLSLLNDKGSFCFITSNSWLDADFGKDLQEFLLKHGHVKLIIDNKVKRSFESAAINTIIALLARPDDAKEQGLTNTARFVMFKIPYEKAFYKEEFQSVIMEEIEEAKGIKKTPEYRCIANLQEEFYKDKESIDENGKYTGNKWGGKYLRAPDIYWKILTTRGNNLILLSSLCDVLGYIHDNNTGKKYEPVYFIKSISEINEISLMKSNPHVRFCGIRENGNSRIAAPILFARTFGDRHLVVWNKENIFAKEFYKIIPKNPENTANFVIQLNSTFTILQREILGLTNLGSGAIKFSKKDIKSIYLVSLTDIGKYLDRIELFLKRKIGSVFEELGLPKPNRDLSNINPHDVSLNKVLPDRRAIDKMVFKALDLTEEEQLEVYKAVVDLVKSRLTKAKSV